MGVRHIIVIEDDEEDFELLSFASHYLEFDFKLERFTCIKDLVNSGQKEGDLLLLDLELPDSSGLASLRAILHELPNMPVVVLTGTFDDGLGEQAVRLGAQDFIQKEHLNADRLEQAMEFALARTAVTRERDQAFQGLLPGIRWPLASILTTLQALEQQSSGERIEDYRPMLKASLEACECLLEQVVRAKKSER